MLMRHESPSYTLGRYTGYAPNTVMGIGEGASTTSVPPSKIVVLSVSRGRQRSIAYNSTARGRRQVVRPKLPKLLARQAPAKRTPIAHCARAAWPPDADNRRRKRNGGPEKALPQDFDLFKQVKVAPQPKRWSTPRSSRPRGWKGRHPS